MGCFVHAMHIPGNPDSKHWPCEPVLPYTISTHILPAGKVSVHCSVSSLTFKNAFDWIWKPFMGCFVHTMHIPGNPDSKYWPCEPVLPYTISAHIIPAKKVSVHCSVIFDF